MAHDDRPRDASPPPEGADRARARLEALAEATFEAIFFSVDGVCLDMNRRAEELIGVPRERFVGHLLVEHIVPEQREMVLKRMLEFYSEPYEAAVLHADGTRIDCEIRGRMIEEDGRAVRVTSVRDLSGRRRAEQALRESERRNRAMVDAIPDLMFVVDRDGRFVDYRQPAGHDLLIPPEEFLGRFFEEVLDEEVARRSRRAAERVFETGQTQSHEYTLDFDGTLRHYESRASQYGRDSALFIVREVTETKRLREAESRSQRLESAGRIAGQVAHDFNNLLAPLTGYPSLILDVLPPGHEAVEMVESMATAAREIAEINQQLLTLGRRGHYTQAPLDLNGVVRQVARRLPPHPDTVVLEWVLEPDLMPALGGEAQLARAVTNLLHNALDAVGDSGRIVVGTENLYVNEAMTRYEHVPVGEYVRLRVADDGVGIAEDVLDRVCEPFFTTKTVDRRRGSGLGLSVVEGVVQDHGGHIDIRSAPGRGTTFDIYLPITRQEEEAPQAAAPEHAGGTVLIVDDDPVQREVASRLLERFGYAVRAVEGGEAALEALREAPADLVVLDMIMPPGIDGAETYRRILLEHPGQRAILVSGYSEGDRVRAAQAMGARRFVRKPVTPESLGGAVAAELAGDPPA